MYPNVVFTCSACRNQFGIAEAISLEMRCLSCRSELVPMDEAWVSGALLTDQKSFSKSGQESFDPVETRVARVLLPSKNEKEVTAVEQFIATLPLPISLEYLGTGEERMMLVRGAKETLDYLAGQFASTWPRSSLEFLENDPVLSISGAVRYGFWLKLRSAQYLPLKTWVSLKQGADPVISLFNSFLGLNKSEQIWVQFFLENAGAPEWLPKIQQRLKLEAQRGYQIHEDLSLAGGSTLASSSIQGESCLKVGASSAAVGLFVLAGFLGYSKLWGLFILSLLLSATLGRLCFFIINRVEDDWSGTDLNLVRRKVIYQDMLVRSYARVVVWSQSPGRTRTLLERVHSSLSQYSLAGGNSLELAEQCTNNQKWLQDVVPPRDGSMWLGPGEIAGLWHPPYFGDNIAPDLVSVRETEYRTPSPEDVGSGYLIGFSKKSTGGHVPVHISDKAMNSGIFLIGKSGTGKTNVMEHLVRAAAEHADQPAIVVIDPHGDLANRLTGSLGPKASDRILYMDIGDTEYVLAFNPLDPFVTQLPAPDIVSTFIDVGQSLWGDYWGPRMQMPLQRTLTALVAANEMRRANDLIGPSLISTFLEASNDRISGFIETNVKGSPHYNYVINYFYRSFLKVRSSLRQDIIQPVLSKGYRFQDSPIFELLSVPESKLNIRQAISDRKILIVNTRQGRKSQDISSFIGSLVINWVIKMGALQEDLGQDERAPIFLMVDEFQSFLGVPWDVITGQMRKFGFRTVLGTQNLASLRNVRGVDLPGIILGGVRTLMSFEISGEDAQKLSLEEFGTDSGGPHPDTLVNLDEYTAYMKTITGGGRRVPAFAFKTAAPLAFDPNLSKLVLKKRAAYSTPIDKARAEAEEKYNLIYEADTLLSGGVSSGKVGKVKEYKDLDHQEAANILIGGGGAVSEILSEQVKPPSSTDSNSPDEIGELQAGLENDLLALYETMEEKRPNNAEE